MWLARSVYFPVSLNYNDLFKANLSAPVVGVMAPKDDKGNIYEMNGYIQAIIRIPKLAFSAFLITCVMKIAAVAIFKFVDHQTGFDESVNLFLHYPKNIKPVLSFFAAIIFVLCVTYLVYPSDVGDFLKRYILIPSFHLCEHMLSLVCGVLVAWVIFETKIEDLNGSYLYGVIFPLSAALAVVAFSACTCAAASHCLENDIDSLLDALGSYRFAVISVIAGILIYAVLKDFVWDFKIASDAVH